MGTAITTFGRLITVFLCAVSTVAATEQANVLCFPVIGDFGGIPFAPYSTFTQRKIGSLMAKIIKRQSCQFIVALGDNFYHSGVKNVNDARFRLTFENTYSDPALQLPWYLIAGNHDHVSNVSAQIAYTGRSHRWKFPSYYHAKVHKVPNSSKTVHIVMIDTSLLCWPKKRSKYNEPTPDEQFSWIEDQLKNSMSEYLVVAGHHPVLSAGLHGNSQCLVDRLKPMLERYNVNIYFSGHDHNLQHIYDKGVNYFVSGSGNFYNGIQFGSHKLPANSLKHFSYHGGGFMIVKSFTRHLSVKVVNHDGRIVYKTATRERKIPQSHAQVDNIGLAELEELDKLYSERLMK